MYTCEDSITLLLDFLDGELPPEQARRLQEHLAGCAPCVDFVRTYRATPGLCKRALEQHMPKEVSDRLTDFLRSKMKPT